MDAVAHLAPTVGIVAACDCLYDIDFGLKKGSDLFASEVHKVELLGVPGGLKFTRGAEFLEVDLPGRFPHDFPLALRITPANLSMLRGA